MFWDGLNIHTHTSHVNYLFVIAHYATLYRSWRNIAKDCRPNTYKHFVMRPISMLTHDTKFASTHFEYASIRIKHFFSLISTCSLSNISSVHDHGVAFIAAGLCLFFIHGSEVCVIFTMFESIIGQYTNDLAKFLHRTISG